MKTSQGLGGDHLVPAETNSHGFGSCCQKSRVRLNPCPFLPRMQQAPSTNPCPAPRFRDSEASFFPLSLPCSAHSSPGLGEPFVCHYLGRGALGAGRGGGRRGRGGGQAGCQVVRDAGQARASLMLTRARKQMVLQPERNFQGVALPQLPRPLHVGPAGLSSLFKARATGTGKGIGLGVDGGCVLGSPGVLEAILLSLSSSLLPPPTPAHLSSTLCPSSVPCLSSACHRRPGPNPSLSWLSSKPASRASFLSQQADHITLTVG